MHKDKRRQRAARVVSWVCSRVCSSPTVAHARLQFAATYAARSLRSLSLPGEIRVKVTAAFLAGKCENSQNENQMQTPAGKRQPATAQKNRHLAREVDA